MQETRLEGLADPTVASFAELPQDDASLLTRAVVAVGATNHVDRRVQAAVGNRQLSRRFSMAPQRPQPHRPSSTRSHPPTRVLAALARLALRALLLQPLDPAANSLGLLLAHAGHRLEAAVVDCREQVVRRAHAKSAPDLLNPLLGRAPRSSEAPGVRPAPPRAASVEPRSPRFRRSPESAPPFRIPRRVGP